MQIVKQPSKNKIVHSPAKKRKIFKNNLIAILFIVPGIFLYTFFFINPIIQSGILSFFKWNGIPQVAKKFVGFDNYIKFFQDPAFYNALLNVLVFIVVSFFVVMPIAYLLALLVSSKIRGARFFKAAYFIPSILPMAATGLMWTFMLFKSGGAINTLLINIGFENLTRDWLGDPKYAIYSVALVNAWIYAGYNMIIFMAGLTNVPNEVIESAKIDGATGFKAQLYVVLPLMKESFKIFAVLAVAGSFKVFDIIFVMTGGGPGGATDVPATMLYDQAFRFNNFGYGSSIGIFILLAALLSTVILNKFLNTKVD